jgi:alkyl hydroperoxide reductase subunit AhpC
MPLRIGDDAPDFTAQSTEGTIKFHDWIGDSWAILFSHPKDFTPVCTTELGYMAKLKPNSTSATRSRRPLHRSRSAITSAGSATSRRRRAQGQLSADRRPDLKVAKLYDMIHPNASGAAPRTARGQRDRALGVRRRPDKKIKLILTYPMSTGRNFDEVLRVLDSMQLTAKHKVATPVNWKQGEDVIIVPSVSNDEAKTKFPGGWKSPKPYLRIVPQPK